MASHHHDGGCHRRHHNHQESIPLIPSYYATSSPCYCADSSPCCTQSNQQPSPPNLDHLLRLIASHLQNQQHQTHCSCQAHSPRFNEQSFVNQQQQRKNVQREYNNLLRKINDLDLSLNRYYTLKDSAARVIQTHFRSYLVYRSISLRQLKKLATIKSSFLSLKSSVSGKTHFPFKAVSREATDLLLQLDSIQGRVDTMIRDGKRTLSRDLVRFLHYIDDCAVKRSDFVCKSSKDVSFKGKCKGTEKLKKQMGTIYVTSNGDDAELEEFHFPMVSSVESSRKVRTSNARVGGDKVKSPVTKSVKFGKSRNVYELTSSVEGNDGEEIMMMSCDDGVGSSNLRSGSRSGVGGKARVMKTVSFDENGNVYKVYGDTPEASVSGGDESFTSGSNYGNGDGYNEFQDLKYVPKENEGFVEDEEEETHSENEEEETHSENEEEETHSENEEELSSEGSKEEEAQVIENVSHTGRNEHKQRGSQLQKGSSMFSPPLPLKMEL